MTPPVLEVANTSVRFGGLLAVNNASLIIQQAELIGFIGPNGAGKTTLMRAITGVIKPQEGAIYLDGKNISELSIHKRVRAGLALAQQIVQPLRKMTLLQNVTLACGTAKTLHPLRSIRFFSRKDEEKRAFELLSQVGLSEAAHAMPSKLPLGYLKRLELARALALNPKLLLLDEPLAGLNQSEASALADLIAHLNRSGLSILLIEHNLREVIRICPKIYVQDQGRSLAFDDTQTVMRRPEVIKAYLGISAAC